MSSLEPRLEVFRVLLVFKEKRSSQTNYKGKGTVSGCCCRTWGVENKKGCCEE